MSIKVPVGSSVGLFASVFLLNLGRIDSFEHCFIVIGLRNLNFVDGDWVQESRDDFPGELDGSRSVDDKHFE